MFKIGLHPPLPPHVLPALRRPVFSYPCLGVVAHCSISWPTVAVKEGSLRTMKQEITNYRQHKCWGTSGHLDFSFSFVSSIFLSPPAKMSPRGWDAERAGAENYVTHVSAVIPSVHCTVHCTAFQSTKLQCTPPLYSATTLPAPDQLTTQQDQ